MDKKALRIRREGSMRSFNSVYIFTSMRRFINELLRGDKDDLRLSLYYLAYGMYITITWVQRTVLIDFFGDGYYPKFEKLAQIVVLVSLLFVYLTDRAKPREWGLSALIVSVGFVAWRTSSEGWLFWISLFVACGREVNINRIAKISLTIVGIVFIASTILPAFGVIRAVVTFRGDGTMRSSWGFLHPNHFGTALITICMAISVLRFRRPIIPTLLVFGVSAALSWMVADSRTAALCLLIAAVLLLAFRASDKNGKERPLIAALFLAIVVLVAISLWFMLNFDINNTIQVSVNKILSGRLRLSNMYYEHHHPGLFGYSYSDGPAYMAEGKAYHFVVDNLYVHVLLRSGIIPWAIFMFSLSLFYIRAFRERYCGSVLFVLTIFLLFGFAETLGARIECNFAILALSILLYNRTFVSYESGKRESNVSSEIRVIELPLFFYRMIGSHYVRH